MYTLENRQYTSNQSIFLTESRLCSLDFNEGEILKIIRDINIHKAHSLDDISIRMIKICHKSLLQPLILLYYNSIKSSRFPDICTRSNIVPVYKKSQKQLIQNYWSISHLPMFNKIFEKIIFNSLYNFLLNESIKF